MNKLEQEAKEFLAKKDKISKEKLLADVKATIALLEAVQVKLKETLNLLRIRN